MTRRLAIVAFATMAIAQIAIPLVDDDRALTQVVIIAFALTTLALASARWGTARAAVAGGVVATLTLAIEWLGSTTGVPFGDYEYTDALAPQVAGVPAVVPLAWFAMGLPALAVGRRLAAGRAARIAAGAVALTAWDLFLDPQMVEAGYWEWAVDGAYRGIPLSNYAGWLLSSVLVMVVLDRVTPAHEPPPLGLLGLYAWWAVMNTVGFVVFLGDPLVGLVGGVVMVPLSLFALRNLDLDPRLPRGRALTTPRRG